MDPHEKRSYLVETLVKIPLNVATMIVPQNSRRIALYFLCTGAATVSSQPQLLSAGQGGGFPGLGTTALFMQGIISRKLHGAMCTSAWYALNSVSADTAEVLEVLEAD